MKNIGNELVNLTEKVVDQNIKGENLDVLGIPIPSSLEEVGVLGAAFSISRVAKAIIDHNFSKAFEKFYNEIDTLTEKQKRIFFDKYPNKDVQDFGEQALLLLNKIEMPLGATLIGRAYSLLVKEEIDKASYYNYCHIIKNINQYLYETLSLVYKKSNKKIFVGGVYSLMESLGLMFEIQEGLYASDSADESNPQAKVTRYMRSEFGKEFYQKIIEPYLQ